MTANAGLVLFLIAFWGALAAWVKIENWWAGKRWSDGPSLIPLIPFLPMLAGVVGWLGNLVASPWGSWGVAGLHVGLLFVGLTLMRMYSSPPQAVAAEPSDGAGSR